MGHPDRLAQVGLGVQTVFAFPTFRRVERDHVITRLQAGHAFANLQDNTRAFMTQDRRKQAFRVGTRQGEFIGVTNSGCLNFDQNLARAGAIKVDLHNLQRFSGLSGHCCSGAHR